jgi:hypothetical protein
MAMGGSAAKHRPRRRLRPCPPNCLAPWRNTKRSLEAAGERCERAAGCAGPPQADGDPGPAGHVAGRCRGARAQFAGDTGPAVRCRGRPTGGATDPDGHEHRQVPVRADAGRVRLRGAALAGSQAGS